MKGTPAYPLVVMVVAFIFAGILLRQYASRRRPHQLVWAAALVMGGLAGLFFVVFLAQGRSPTFFKLYYICGALLMAGYLGLGEIYLLAPRRAANLTALAVAAASVIGLVLVLAAPVDARALQGSNVLAGTKAISGPAVIFIVLLNTFGALAVIGGALYSAWRLLRGHGPVHLLVANTLIACGTILASLAGTLARVTGNENAFWGLLAAGFVVLFVGFLLTTRRSVPASSQVPAAAGQGT